MASHRSIANLLRGIGLLAIEGASLGLFAYWARADADRIQPYAAANQITSVGRTFILVNMAVGLVLAVGVGAAVAWKQRGEDRAALIERLGRRGAPLMLAGWLPFLFESRLWGVYVPTMLVMIALFGLCLQGFARMRFSTAPVPVGLLSGRLAAPLERAQSLGRRWYAAMASSRWLPWAVLSAAVLGYAVYFSYHTIQTHYRIGTAAYDLGIEDNVIWNILRGARLFKASPLGGPDTVHSGWHQTYFAFAIAPLYALFPGPEILLIVQSVMIALAAIPLYLLARRKLGAGTALVLSVAYLLYPPVHGSNLYDFHYQPLSTVFLFAILHLLLIRRDALAAIAIVLAFSLREDISALVAVVGLYLVITGIRPRAGLVVMSVGGLYFFVLKFLIMPRFLDGAHGFINQYQALVGPGERGFGGVLKTVFANPFFTLSTLLERDKFLYVLQMFTPLVFLPWRRPIGLLCCLPGFFFTLLATQYPPLNQISFQYTAYWTPFLFMACVAALDWFREREQAGVIGPASRRAWVVGLAGAMLVSSYQFGTILNTRNARGGFGPYRFGLTAQDHQRHRDAYALIVQVPPLVKVSASEHVNPHLSARPDAYTLRNGLHDAEWVMFEVPTRHDEKSQVVGPLRSGTFGVVDHRGQFVLAKKGHPTTKNAEILKKLGP
jgi:uncharacterized membrane protein